MNLWLRLFLPFALGYFFSYFLRNANAVIAPELTRELSLTATDLGALTGAYLAAFGAAQLPLGLLLDRFGPRRVESALLLFAVAGCVLFAVGETVPVLLAARALIGVGVSACLMASFATFSRWFEPTRQASLNGAVMAAGAAGALSASAPLVTLTSSLGWRGTFLAFALIGVALSVAIFSTPERAAAGAGGKAPHWLDQAREIGGIASSRAYWVFAPQAVFMIGGFMALQSLWAVPFLMQADGLTRNIAAHRMMLSAVGMLVGFISVAVFAQPLVRRGVALERVLGASVGVAIVALSLITLGADPMGWLWVVLGACYGVSNLSYALLQRRFALALAGRVNTTLNLLAFGGAFIIQWVFGAVIDAATTAGIASELAYRATLGTLVACQLLSWLWFMVGLRRLP